MIRYMTQCDLSDVFLAAQRIVGQSSQKIMLACVLLTTNHQQETTGAAHLKNVLMLQLYE